MIGLWTGVVTACVDPINLNLPSTIDILVVNSRITNQIGAQQVRLSRAKADPLTGRPGSLPVTGALVALLVDSSQTIALKETDAGTYQAPADFVGQVGHAYQLRFTLADGRRYTSSTEVMQAVPPISQVRAQFNANSLPPDQRLEKVYAAAHDFYITTQDPAAQHNYYHWGWKLWERQDWCCSCSNAIYLVYDPTDPSKRYEACFDVSAYIYSQYFTYDYNCRSRCWEVFEGYAINVFDDQYTNGGTIKARRVAQIPFYQHEGCLVEIQQGSLTAGAYRYYKLLEDQTQNTGSLADTPPTLLAGNVHNNANSKESVMGYFTAEAVTSVRYWLDRQDTQTTPPGLFHALNGREANPEDNRPKGFGFLIYPNADRPPTALCIESDNRTPNKPPGWRD